MNKLIENVFCLIMAGGSGTRFWPRSKVSRPKQYLRLFGNESLLQSTVRRSESIVPKEKILIVSSQSQAYVLEEQTPGIPPKNLIYEPVGKNTLPCIGLAAMIAEKENPDGVMVVSPSDHLIGNTGVFCETVNAAVEIARKRNGIVTIGITPAYAATGFGYVQVSGEIEESAPIRQFMVNRFVEKPDQATAEKYLDQGGFYWNSGMFVFKISVFLQAIREFEPELYSGLRKIQASEGTPEFPHVLDTIYREVKSISVDYGIMEHARNLFLVEGNFTWNDLGSWESVYQASVKDGNGNVSDGETMFVDSNNSYVYADSGIVSVVGLADVIVVKDGDSILVCRRDKAEAVKGVVEALKEQNKNHYL